MSQTLVTFAHGLPTTEVLRPGFDAISGAGGRRYFTEIEVVPAQMESEIEFKSDWFRQ